ncbi:hypothetical protein CONLIGDRAFT_492850 [Coniochaeta ligniaria NRRL 30616]|uniref:Yeast cell wall synthesis Kre9/Knh1-like N-terminal domain-containing protein n=1 Tax=Coniochaeta ligniaria NRRL 30616 TaxID=1408157 RepID=A0A1J7JCF5_9PEZI|nr:hypothetical protein CONLIGDRAFT_492850 [Coniochaeta ligniaria NRRL 30616]
MFAKTVVTLAILAAAQANTAWDFSQTNTIEWTSVSTDPSNFSIVLVDNSSSSGPKETVIKDLVNTADDKYSFSNVVVAAPGDKFQIRFVGTTATNTGIVTQSENFNVTKSGVAATTTSASTGGPSGTATGAPAATTSAKGNGAGALKAAGGVGAAVGAVFYMLL